MTARRVLPTEETAELVRLVRQIAADELAERSVAAEADGTFPRDIFLKLGRAGLLGLPYPEEYGGGAVPYEVYLQVLEEIGAVWASVGVGVSVHVLSCYGLATRGTDEQKQAGLPARGPGGEEGGGAAGRARGGAARGVLPLRAARRLGPRGDADHRPAR